MSKVYMIVTNDEYETPVKCDIIGAKAVAEYMGISLSYLYCMVVGSKPWSIKLKYKAICIGEAKLKQKNKNMYSKKYAMEHDRTEYYRQWYLKNKQKRSN